MKRIFVTILICIAIISCTKPTAGSGTLQGWVYLKENENFPISEVSVIYGDSAILTNKEGYFRYDSIPEGLQGITFKKDGYHTNLVQMNITRESLNECSVELEIAKCGWAVGNLDSYYGTILRTTDQGKTWLRQGAPSLIPEVNMLNLCALNDNECFVVGEPDTIHRKSTILYTSNGGEEWQNIATSTIPLVSYGSVITKDGKTIFCASSDSCHIIYSTDKGKSWKSSLKSENMKFYSAITTYDGVNIWACGMDKNGGAGIEYSPDGGTTWEFTHLGNTTSLQYATDIYADMHGYIFVTVDSGGGLWTSDDKGETWSVSEALSEGNSLYTISLFDSSKMWIGGIEGTLHSTTDGKNFTNTFPGEEPTSSIVRTVSFLRDGLNGAILVTNASGLESSIYYTTNSGVEWNKSSIPYNFLMNSIDFVGGNN